MKIRIDDTIYEGTGAEILEQLRLASFIAGRMEEHRFRYPPALVCLPGAGPPAGPSGLRRSDLRLRPGVGRPGPPAWEGSLGLCRRRGVRRLPPELAERLSPVQRQHRPAAQRGDLSPVLPDRRSQPSPSGGPCAGLGRHHPRGSGPVPPLLYAAQARPRWTFLLLGRREQNPLLHRLARLPNVHFLPPLAP